MNDLEKLFAELETALLAVNAGQPKETVDILRIAVKLVDHHVTTMTRIADALENLTEQQTKHNTEEI